MTDILQQLLADIPLPQMVKVRQRFDDSQLADPLATLGGELEHSEALRMLAPGARVAVCVGSRGIAMIDGVVRTVVAALRAQGTVPFIVPCMGSHGGATAEGQAAVLSHLGIDEQTVGAPVRASMEVVQLDKLANGLPVYADRIVATEADAVVVINRVKPHTAFRGRFESGLLKMLAIGLGNQKGAEACHQLGFGHMADHVVQMSRIMRARLPIVFGVAVVENAYDRICEIAVLSSDEMEDRESELLQEAKRRMPRIWFDPIDVLIIDRIGKNISGDGMDPNITGRYPTPYAQGGPAVSKMVVLDLTAESGGNANGVGAADFTTRRLVEKADWTATYANGLTSTVCGPTKMATVLANDRMAIQAAVKTCNILDYHTCRLVRVRDTLHLSEIWVSQALAQSAADLSQVEVLTRPTALAFDEAGNLL